MSFTAFCLKHKNFHCTMGLMYLYNIIGLLCISVESLIFDKFLILHILFFILPMPCQLLHKTKVYVE